MRKSTQRGSLISDFYSLEIKLTGWFSVTELIDRYGICVRRHLEPCSCVTECEPLVLSGQHNNPSEMQCGFAWLIRNSLALRNLMITSKNS